MGTKQHLQTLLLVALTVWLVAPVLAQSELPTFVPVAPEIFSNSFVRCFYKDSKGYMWIGASEGLVRYDGTNAFRYEHDMSTPNSLCHSHINALAEDQQHQIWVATGNGLCIYDRQKDHFTNIDSLDTRDSLNNHFVTALMVDPSNRLWIGTLGGGVNVYDQGRREFTYLMKSEHVRMPPTNHYVNCFLMDGDTVWAGTKDGLVFFDLHSMAILPPPEVAMALRKRQITQIVQDKTGSKWISTADGDVLKITGNKGTFRLETVVAGRDQYGAAWNNVVTLAPDLSGNLWIGGEISGLSLLDTRTNALTRFLPKDGGNSRFSTNSVRSVMVDEQGMVWVGTYNRGAYQFANTPNEFETFGKGGFTESDLAGRDIRAFTEDAHGNVWIGVDRMGLIRWDAATNQLTRTDDINKLLETKSVMALHCDRKGSMWIGTIGTGVLRYQFSTGQLHQYSLTSGGFGDNKIYCMYEDSKGTFWVGTSGSGLFYLDKSTDSFVPFYEPSVENYIPNTAYIGSITEDVNGTLWVGTMYGLYRLTRNADNSFSYKMYLPDRQSLLLTGAGVNVVFEDVLGNLWIGTSYNGLVVWDAERSTAREYQKKHGLASNYIRSIVQDATGNLWIGTNMGLSKLNPYTHEVINYTKNDGLASNNLHVNAALKTEKGILFLGSNNGLIAFHPDSLSLAQEPPAVYFTNLRINNQLASIDAPGSPLSSHISLTQSLSLSYEQRSFAIDYAAINFHQSRQYKYCYKLEGFDTEWNCVGTETRATYTNIDPGEYRFLVKASVDGTVWSTTPTVLHIEVRQVVWKTWWAMTIYTLALASLVLFIVKFRMDRLKMKNQLIMEIVAREKEHELSESKTQFFTDISHELRTPLSLISMPLQSLSAMDELPEKVRERIQTIRVSSEKMMRLVNELMDFQKMENAKLNLRIQQGELVHFVTNLANIFTDLSVKSNIHFAVHALVRRLEGWFDHDKLEKIVVNVISNAFKFTTENGQINVVLNSRMMPTGERETRCLELVIIDNGMGISAEELPFIFDKFYQSRSAVQVANPGTGIGLALTKGLVQLHHGSIEVASIPNSETKFTILIPIDRHAYQDEEIMESPFVSDDESVFGADAPDISQEIDEDSESPVILVVEDNDELRKYVGLELRSQFNVLEAKDGLQGKALAVEKCPDLIISDILMPNMSGTELCAEIKTNLKTSHIPFIMLTAKITVEDQIAGVQTGADVYITKPFNIRFLLAQVNQIIESRRKLYARFSHDVYLMPAKVATNQMDQDFLQKAISYVVNNIQNPQLGVESIAELFHMSRMQVYRKIKALTGSSVVDFIRMVRMKEALKLMETHQFTLSEIAHKTGFSSASYFTRSFKEHYGKAPSEYLGAEV